MRDQTSLTAKISFRRSRDSSALAAAKTFRTMAHRQGRRARTISAKSQRRDSARRIHLHYHRRLGLRQIDARPRQNHFSCTLAEIESQPRARRRLQDARGRRTPRQSHPRRSESHRTHAALESRDLHPACSPISASSLRNCPKRGCAATGPGVFLSTSRAVECEACEGDGIIRIEMHFLPDVYVTCEVCGGKRYNRDTLEIQYKGKNIAEVLNMTVLDAVEFLGSVPPIRQKLETLRDVGPRLHSPRTVGDDALGRRGATDQAREGTCAGARRAAPFISSTSRLPACTSTTSSVCFGVLGRLADAGNTIVVNRAQPRRDQDGRLRDRSRTRRRRPRRPGSRERIAGRSRRREGLIHRAIPALSSKSPRRRLTRRASGIVLLRAVINDAPIDDPRERREYMRR